MNIGKILFLLAGIIFVIGSSVPATDDATYFNYLKSLYDRHEKKLSGFLLEELDLFTEIHPESDFNSDALFYSGKVYLDRNDPHEAMATFLKMMYLYPGSTHDATAATEINEIIGKSATYKGKVEMVTIATNSVPKDDSREDRHYAYINFLYELSVSKLYDYALDEFYEFIEQYPDDDRVEKVHRLIAGTLTGSGDYLASIAAYKKYEILYPESEHVPGVMNHRAVLLYERIKNYDNAIAVLNDVIEKYPGTEHEANAYYFRAEIKANKLKDYESSIADYRAVTNKMPDCEKAPDALLAMARIAEKKLKGFNAAIVYYDEVANRYPEDKRTITALEESSRIHIKLREYDQAATKLARIATQFPKYEKSVTHLMKAGKICAEKLKEYKRAVGYYQLVKTQYPNTKAATSADKKLAKLQQKIDW